MVTARFDERAKSSDSGRCANVDRGAGPDRQGDSAEQDSTDPFLFVRKPVLRGKERTFQHFSAAASGSRASVANKLSDQRSYFAEIFGIELNDLIGLGMLLLFVPAVIIGCNGERGVADLCLAGQKNLGYGSHSDQLTPRLSEKETLSLCAEARPLDTAIGRSVPDGNMSGASQKR